MWRASRCKPSKESTSAGRQYASSGFVSRQYPFPVTLLLSPLFNSPEQEFPACSWAGTYNSSHGSQFDAIVSIAGFGASVVTHACLWVVMEAFPLGFLRRQILQAN